MHKFVHKYIYTHSCVYSKKQRKIADFIQRANTRNAHFIYTHTHIYIHATYQKTEKIFRFYTTSQPKNSKNTMTTLTQVEVLKSPLAIVWQGPMRCLKLQASSRKRATNYRAVLRKETYEDTASYGSSPPCTQCTKQNDDIADFGNFLQSYEIFEPGRNFQKSARHSMYSNNGYTIHFRGCFFPPSTSSFQQSY